MKESKCIEGFFGVEGVLLMDYIPICIEGWGGLTTSTSFGIDGGTVLYIPMGKYVI